MREKMGYRMKCLIELHSTSWLAALVHSLHSTRVLFTLWNHANFIVRKVTCSKKFRSLENEWNDCVWWGLRIDSVCNCLFEKWAVNCRWKTPYSHAHSFVRHVQVLKVCVCIVATTILFICTAVCNNFVGLHLSWPQSERSKKIEQNHLITICSEKKKLLFRRINTPIFSSESFLFCLLAQWLKIESFTHSLTKFECEREQ